MSDLFYELFLNSEMWGYLGPLGLVIGGYIVAQKNNVLGLLWFVLECLFIAQYFSLVSATLDRRSVHISLSTMGPKTVITWGRRSLYVVLFISFLIVYGNFHNPITFTFLGSMLCLIIPILFFLKDENWPEEDYS
ncbi:MAG: hypothetical protein ACYTDW_21865 [Planctomycetota bacterium]